MGFERGRHAATVDRPRLTNRRREYLIALHAAVQAHPALAGQLVERRGVSWVAVRDGVSVVDVGCDYRDGAWWFCRLDDGSVITRADDVAGCVDVLGRE